MLKKYVEEGKHVYMPTNYRDFGKRLVLFCTNRLGLNDDEVMFYHAGSSKELKKEIRRARNGGSTNTRSSFQAACASG